MKKSKKGILSIILSFIMLFIITGCGKTVITESDFRHKAENHNYEVVDVTNEYNAGRVEKVLTINLRGGEIYFYIFPDEVAANNLFDDGQRYYESLKGGLSSELSSSMGNYSTYALTSDGYYMYICRVDNTVVAAKVKESSKEIVKTFIKELGY